MATNRETPRFRRRARSGVIWPKLNRGTARFYTAVRYSIWGRFMTSYRNTAFRSADKNAYAEVCRTVSVSPARQRLVASIESGGLVRGGRALLGGVLDCPTACYGLFGTQSHTQQAVAEHFGISRSYVSRIEKRALDKLREALGDD